MRLRLIDTVDRVSERSRFHNEVKEQIERCFLPARQVLIEERPAGSLVKPKRAVLKRVAEVVQGLPDFPLKVAALA